MQPGREHRLTISTVALDHSWVAYRKRNKTEISRRLSQFAVNAPSLPLDGTAS
jgi:hypothetical protein